jgi:hypothetical protein
VLYGLSSSTPGSLYTINSATGAATLVTNLSVSTAIVGLEARNGVLYASDVDTGDGAFHFGTINPFTGAFTALNSQGGRLNFQGLAYNPGPDLFYTVDAEGSSLQLKSITPDGSTITNIGTVGQAIRGLAYDSNHSVLYGVAGSGAGSGNLFTINTSTAAATLIGTTGVNNALSGLEYDTDNNVLYMNVGAGDNSLYSVNTTTGAATLVGSNGPVAGVGIEGLAFMVPPPNRIIALTSVAQGTYGNKLTQSTHPGADQATFSPNNSDNIIHVTGSGGSYVPGFADPIGGTVNGENKFFTEATGWSPTTDQELYALNIRVNNADPTASQIQSVVNDINDPGVGNTGNFTASVLTGQFASIFPGYDILLTADAGTVSPEFLGIDFSVDSHTPGVTVTGVAAIPEPASATSMLLAAAGLLLRRRTQRAPKR